MQAPTQETVEATSELQSLLERVEAATGYDESLDFDVCKALCLVGEADLIEFRGESLISPPPLSASLDAVLALVEEKLPGWHWQINSNADHNGDAWGASARLHVDLTAAMLGSGRWTEGATPAIAMLAALLRALIAQQEEVKADG